MTAREPATADVRTSAGHPVGPAGGARQTVQSLMIRWHQAVARGRHGAARWSYLLLALATGSNGWTAPHRVTAPGRRTDR
jgi:hypothetical protein